MKQPQGLIPEQAVEAMREVLRVPGVRHVAVVDAIGLCLVHVGHEPVANALLNDWTVVARSAFAACDQLGHRSGAGPCGETSVVHREGGTYLLTVGAGMLLVVQHLRSTPGEPLRTACAEVAGLLPASLPPRPAERAGSPQPKSHGAAGLVQEAEIIPEGSTGRVVA